MTKFQYQKPHGGSIFKQAYVVIGKKQYESLEYVGDSKHLKRSTSGKCKSPFWEKVDCEWNSWPDKGEIADEIKQNIKSRLKRNGWTENVQRLREKKTKQNWTKLRNSRIKNPLLKDV